MKIKDILIAIANKTPLQRLGYGWYSTSASEVMRELVSGVYFTDIDLDVDLPSFRAKPKEVKVNGIVYELPAQKTLGETELYTVRVNLTGVTAVGIPRTQPHQTSIVKESSNYFTTLEDAQLIADLFNAILKETVQ